MTDHGHFHWNELVTADPERAKTFYAETIGWSFEGMPMEDGATYWVAMSGGKPSLTAAFASAPTSSSVRTNASGLW